MALHTIVKHEEEEIKKQSRKQDTLSFICLQKYCFFKKKCGPSQINMKHKKRMNHCITLIKALTGCETIYAHSRFLLLVTQCGSALNSRQIHTESVLSTAGSDRCAESNDGTLSYQTWIMCESILEEEQQSRLHSDDIVYERRAVPREETRAAQ